MPGLLSSLAGPRRVLLVIPTVAEAEAALGARLVATAALDDGRVIRVGAGLDLVISGVGKANAASAAALAVDREEHAGVVVAGFGGALPGSGLEPGETVVATACVFADEGLLGPEGFVPLGAMGFRLGRYDVPVVPVDGAWVEALRPVVTAAGPIATVSQCSGTDEAAERVAERTGAIAESMEGAAVARVCQRVGVAVAELRAMLNTTGDRGSQRRDVAAAGAALRRVIGEL